MTIDSMPFIIASYALGVIVPVVLALSAFFRLRRAERRFAALDPRAGRHG